MANLYYDASKYIIAVLFALCTFESFFALRYLNKENRTAIYVRQYIMMLLIHASGYFVICLKREDFFYLIFFAAQELLFIALLNLYKVLYPGSSRLLMNQMILFLMLGMIMLSRLSRAKAIRQFIIIAVSCVISLCLPAIIHKLALLKKLTFFYAGLGAVALGIVLVLGAVTNGSKISYTIVGITFQPSELVKIVFIFFLAALFSKELNRIRILISAGVTALYVVILVCSKDLGSAAIFFVAYVFMLFIASGKLLALLGAFAAGIGGCLVSYKLFYHVKVRVIAWLNPWRDITGKGYQLAQSLFALGTGGWFGLGICQGVPESIPYVEADFIFSAIAEEMGVIVGLCLILLCISCFLLMMKIALSVHDRFYKLIASGIAVTYIFQVLLTIGGGTKFIPLTGVTLPLVSYGGSSVFTTICMFAIMQGICLIKVTEQRNAVPDENPETQETEETADDTALQELITQMLISGQVTIDPEHPADTYLTPVIIKDNQHEEKKRS